MKKEILILSIFFLFSNVSALAIFPGKVEFNFEPGKVIVQKFDIYPGNAEGVVSLSLSGDLAKYSSLDRYELMDSNRVYLTINLPENLQPPGIHGLMVTAQENLTNAGPTFGTAIKLSATVDVHVPYPGKYVEGKLEFSDVNVGEDIPIEIYLVNRGSEKCTARTEGQLFTSDKFVREFSFSNIDLNVGEEKSFSQKISGEGLQPGNYIAKFLVDYGGEQNLKLESSFRIGFLFINITNFTTSLVKGGLQKFVIDIESRWNKEIEGIYAEVSLFNNTSKTSFKTPPVDKLGSWGKQRLEGYVDTSTMSGLYNVSITLKYAGQSTNVEGTLLVYPPKKEKNFIFSIIAIAVLLILLIIGLIVFFVKKKKSIKRKF